MTAQSPLHPLDVRALPGTRETIAYHEGGLFPVLAATTDGTVVAIVRGGAGHLGTTGRIEAIRWLDRGQTWSPPIVIADSDRDDRNPAIGVSSRGTLVLAYHRQGSYDAAGAFRPVPIGGPTPRPIEIVVTRSVDGGLTWEEPFPLSVESLRAASPFGKIAALPGGTLLMPIYIHDHATAGLSAEELRRLGPARYGSYVARSDDDGRTWTDPTLIAPAMDECALLVFPDGDVLALLRASDPEAALWSARSGDGGQTWSSPVRVTGPRQHPADLTLLADGEVLLCYGNRTPPFRIEGRISRDGGRTWLARLLTFSGPLYGTAVDADRRTDLGYPSTAIVPDGAGRRGVTMYYYNPSIPRAGDWRAHGASSSFYQVTGYRAVAVTWDETELLAAIAGRANE